MALDYLHTNRVLHRDLKVSSSFYSINILLHPWIPNFSQVCLHLFFPFISSSVLSFLQIPLNIISLHNTKIYNFFLSNFSVPTYSSQRRTISVLVKNKLYFKIKFKFKFFLFGISNDFGHEQVTLDLQNFSIQKTLLPR